MRPDLLRHLSNEPLGRFPVWLMRQAGRFLPSYRTIREQHSFWEMVTRPAIATEVTLLPIRELDVDAAILFSDILTLPYGFGVPIRIDEGVGPVVERPLRAIQDFERLATFDPKTHTPFVGEALSKIRVNLPPQKTVIGFAGAPWTLAAYLIDGGGKNRQWKHCFHWMHSNPTEFRSAIEQLANATSKYLLFQIESGAEVVQLFDTWLGEMPRSFFADHYLPLLNQIFDRIRAQRTPVIYFSKSSHHLFDLFQQLHADVISVDQLTPLEEADKNLGHRFSLQGNLDPLILFESPDIVRFHTRALCESAKKLSHPAIINLGHGVLPGTPVENVQIFINEAKQLWI